MPRALLKRQFRPWITLLFGLVLSGVLCGVIFNGVRRDFRSILQRDCDEWTRAVRREMQASFNALQILSGAFVERSFPMRRVLFEEIYDSIFREGRYPIQNVGVALHIPHDQRDDFEATFGFPIVSDRNELGCIGC